MEGKSYLVADDFIFPSSCLILFVSKQSTVASSVNAECRLQTF